MTKHIVLRAFTAFGREYKSGYVLTDTDLEIWAAAAGGGDDGKEAAEARRQAHFQFSDITLHADEAPTQ